MYTCVVCTVFGDTLYAVIEHRCPWHLAIVLTPSVTGFHSEFVVKVPLNPNQPVTGIPYYINSVTEITKLSTVCKSQYVQSGTFVRDTHIFSGLFAATLFHGQSGCL